MKRVLVATALVCVSTTGCVAGPGGVHNAANRTLAGVAIGTLLGGVAGHAMGDTAGGLALGAIAGGGVGAVMNPKVLDNDTRGYCYVVDAHGQPIALPSDSVECKAAMAGSASPVVQQP
jgi:uncharacterized membrane protein